MSLQNAGYTSLHNFHENIGCDYSNTSNLSGVQNMPFERGINLNN